jgi:hypothetical protein
MGTPLRYDQFLRINSIHLVVVLVLQHTCCLENSGRLRLDVDFLLTLAKHRPEVLVTLLVFYAPHLILRKHFSIFKI